jgi:predicted RNA-binding Zn ribbon-like protein
MSKTAKAPASRAASLPLIGGALALDFCNTSSGRGTEGWIEHLRSTADVLAWARHATALNAVQEQQLRHLCEADRRFASRLLTKALGLREAIYHLVSALARGEDASQGDIDRIAASYAACLSKGRLEVGKKFDGWTWVVEEAPAEAVLGPIASSAVSLITTAPRTRLKQCAGHHCGWLFLDTTKSNNRRWCEMEVCGNRAKQKRRRGKHATPG